ncbi:MAG: sigma 54-interacting transcriptional regulator, partial [Planctomycetes bacterium]|nr:sigma 54-interacting transcriptional regulator [Planctomycetota bacterium]
MPASASISPSLGTRFVLEQELAGGQGGVRVAFDRSLGQRVVLRREARAFESFAGRRRLEHPGLARVLGAVEVEGEGWLIEELVVGRRWDEAPPREEEAWWLAARDLLAALHALHAHGLVHRDLKPENAILAPRARGGAGPVLIDFGLAVPLGARVGPGGTLGTAAPEIFRGGRAEVPADLFGAGALLLSAALGVAPQPAWSLEDGAIERALAAVPHERRALLDRLCASEPARRSASAAAALELVPRAFRERALPAASQVPLVGRGELLDRVHEAARARGAQPLLVVLDGPRGIGKQRLAHAIARELAFAARDQELLVQEHGVLPRAGSAALAEWLRMRADAPAAYAIGVLASASDRAAYEEALPEGELLHLEVPPLDERAIEELLRQLGLAGLREARVLREQTGGVPAAIAEQLVPARALQELRAPARELVACAYLRDLPSALPAERAEEPALLEALEAGALELTREGELRATRPWLAPELLRESSAAMLTRVREAAARNDGAAARTPSDAAWLALLSSLVTRGTAKRARAASENALAEAAAAFARATTETPQLEQRLFLFAAVAAESQRAEALQALVPGLRRLLGEGRLEVVERVLARTTSDAESALHAALAGRLAFERGALESSLARLQQAAAAFPEDLDVQHDLLRALQSAGRWSAVQELCAAIEGHGGAATPEQRAVLAQARALAFLRTGDREQAAATLRTSLDELPEEPPRALRLLALQNLGLVERHRGALADAARAFEAASRGFSRLGDPRNSCLVEANLAVLYQDAGEPARARELAERVARRASKLGLLALASIARATAAIASARLGASPRAAELLRAAEQELRSAKLTREAALAGARRAQVELELEEHASAAESELRSLLTTDARHAAPVAAAIAATALLDHGRALELPWSTLRELLRGADRGSADHLRCAWDRARRGALDATRRGARLERLAARALPELAPLAFAAAARLGGPRAITRAAQALRAARAIHVPRRAIEAWLAAAAVALELPRARPLQRASRELARHFEALREPALDGNMNETAELRRYDAELRELASRAASLPRGGARTEEMLRTLASLNALLLDERVPEAEKCARILDAAVHTTGAARGALLVREADGSERLVASSGLEAADANEEHRQLSRSVLARVLETGQPVRTVDAMADPQFRHALSVAHFHLSSIACVPLRAGARTIGALYLDHPHERGAFAEDVLERLATLADQASLSLATARQRERIAALNAQLEVKLAQSTRELADARAEIAATRGATTVVHQSAIMRALLERVQRIAVSELPALVRGETGTGKELVARRLHELSPRREGPFVSENCSALPG